MNRKLYDQIQTFELPELLEDCLEEGDARCIAFNRWGTILAVGLGDGRVIFWDFDTRGVARSTQMHSAAVTGLAFSRDGRLLTATSADGSAKLWNIEKDYLEGEMNLGQHILHVSVCGKDARLCLVSFPSIAPSLIDFSEERSQTLPCLQLDLEREKVGRPSVSGLHEGTMAAFNATGDLVFLVLANGCIAVLRTSNLRFVDLIKVPGGSKALSMALSQNGRYLIVNYQDRIIRGFTIQENGPGDRHNYSLPELKATLAGLQQVPAEGSVLNPGTPLLWPGTLTFQNFVDKTTWQCASFTPDSEHVAAAPANKGAHHICIWSICGRLERILEGPNDNVRDFAWHPRRSLMASVSSTGAIYLWATIQTENWSAFAPGFTELLENEEYIEPEDVFDVNTKQQDGAPANGVMPMETGDDNGPIDILTLQLHSGGSDKEDDQPGFTHIPVEILAQEFDEKGQLVVAKEEAPKDQESPEPSSLQESEPAISDAGDSKQPSMEPEGQAAAPAPENEQGFRLRPSRAKRYHDDSEDEDFLDDSSGGDVRRGRAGY